jgi:hypothetical protein
MQKMHIPPGYVHISKPAPRSLSLDALDVVRGAWSAARGPRWAWLAALVTTNLSWRVVYYRWRAIDSQNQSGRAAARLI